MSEDNKPEQRELTESEVIEQSKRIFQIRYDAAMEEANRIMAGFSARNIQRAFNAAMALALDQPSKQKLTHEKEARLAGLLAQALDSRTILQGYKIKEEQTKQKEVEDVSKKMD